MDMEEQQGINTAAQELGRLSASKRKAKLGEEGYREYQKMIARRPRPKARFARKKKKM